MYSREQLIDLAVRGATIDERLSQVFEATVGSRADTDAAGRRLAAWCQSAASGDWRLFAKRLVRDGLTLETVLPRLGAVHPARDTIPVWAEDADWIVPAMISVPSPAFTAALNRVGAPQPFEPLLVGLVAEAARRRNALLPPGTLDRLDASVRDSMTHALLTSLAKLCAMAIYENFAVCRQAWEQEAKSSETPPPLPTRHYDRFIVEMRRAGVRRLFDTKPVLLRLVASLTRQWIGATSEFLTRLDADLPELRKTLLGQKEASAVAAVEMGLSDLHNFGRSVYIVRFADGKVIVYKPKSLAVDVHWANLIAWLNERGAPVDLRAAKVLPRSDHGWSEFIVHGDCRDVESAALFFRRAGALICLCYLLVGSDMHEENMIAAGDHPVLIDLEMLLQAVDPPAETDTPAMRAFETAQKKVTQSVLTTGLLPAWMRTPETAMLSVGGLNGNESGKPEEVAWGQVNSDAMAPVREPWKPNKTQNLPLLNGAAIRLADYIDDLADSCAKYFRFLLQHKTELLSSNGPVAAFAETPIRRVLKPTRFYALLLDRVRNHRDMKDGAEWSAHLDFVSRLADWDKDSEPLWPLFAGERRALADANIPFFVHPANGDQVRDGPGTVTVASGLSPGLVEARRRIEALDEADIAWQIAAVRTTVIDSDGPDPMMPKPRGVRAGESLPLDPKDALTWSDRIAERLAKNAIRDGDGAAWIGLDPLADGGGWQLVALGYDLYGGAPGIALFLAAHAKLRDSASSRALALAALAPVRHTLHGNGKARFSRVFGVGGGSGLGSLIYALTTIGQSLDDDGITDDALAATRLMTDDVIASDKVFDIIGGAAGGILGLLKLHRVTGDPLALERAVACGRHLLNNRRSDGPKLWRHMNPRTLAGFSHGAAGFAYALAALASASGNDAFAKAARDCLVYEQSLFSPERGNWPDLREIGEHGPYFPCQWCHGAGGIGLARLGIKRFGDIGIDMTPDITIALNAVGHAWPSSIDTLCCGNLGNIELLAEAGRAFGRDDLQAQAAARVRGVIDAATIAGAYGWNGGSDDENLGLFRGLAGVGYSLLRRVAPDTVPNVLIWE